MILQSSKIRMLQDNSTSRLLLYSVETWILIKKKVSKVALMITQFVLRPTLLKIFSNRISRTNIKIILTLLFNIILSSSCFHQSKWHQIFLSWSIKPVRTKLIRWRVWNCEFELILGKKKFHSKEVRGRSSAYNPLVL